MPDEEVALIVVVGLGANLGDRAASIERAMDRLARLPGVRAFAASPIYETDPVGGPPQGAYLNAAVKLEIDPPRSPRSIVSALLALEQEMGRVRGGRDAPRTIDLDLLWIEGVTSDHPDAEVPHPRLAERAFALAPLLDVVPDARAPDGERYADKLARLDRSGVRRFAIHP